MKTPISYENIIYKDKFVPIKYPYEENVDWDEEYVF
jgi:hypothetical protein